MPVFIIIHNSNNIGNNNDGQRKHFTVSAEYAYLFKASPRSHPTNGFIHFSSIFQLQLSQARILCLPICFEPGQHDSIINIWQGKTQEKE